MDVEQELRSRGVEGPVIGEEPIFPRLSLPNGARVAVTVQLAFEAWAGKGHGMSVLGSGLSDEALAMGLPDFATVSWQHYGGRTGVWRLLRVLDKWGVKASCSVSGLAAEIWPDAVAAVSRAGHEVVGHGYAQDQRMEAMDEEADLDVVTRCTEVLESVAGQRPVGWSSHGSRRGPFTVISLLKNGYLYTNDFRDSDVPYVAARLEGRSLWSLPRTDEINDMYLLRQHGQPPGTYVDYFRRAVDQVQEEGATDPKVVACVAHATIIGRPWGASALGECLEYAKSRDDIWIGTRRELAEHVSRNSVALTS